MISKNSQAHPTRRPRRFMLVAAAVVALTLLVASTSCRATLENRDPVGEALPTVTGESLDREMVTLPLDEPTIMLVGYVQDAQFDADRWLVGLLQVAPAARILEVPTLTGLFPRMLGDTIDNGMRSGIPSEDWETVVTLYGEDAERIFKLTGNENPRNMRVLLVDAEGTIRWFHDRGFSASKLLDLERTANALAGN